MSIRFAIVNGVSANTGMRWDIEYTRDLLGYEPLDDVTRSNSRTHLTLQHSERDQIPTAGGTGKQVRKRQNQ